MIIIFSVPYLAWRAVAADDMAPLVVVQILAGIALGPGVLGAAFPELHALVFRPLVVQALTGIAWWAVMLFVWIAGLELDLRATWRRRRETGVTAALALGVPLLAGALLAVLLMRWPGWMGAQAQPWQFVAGIGMACAVTALPILILFLENLGILRQPLGQRILRYASLDDVAIWGVLAVILMDWQRVGRQLAFLLVFALAALACRALMRRWAARDRWHLALTWLLLVAFAADWCGLHFMVGAFLAGATLEAEWFARKDLDQLRHLLLLVLMPVFFLSTGLRTQWGVGGLSVLGVAALLLLASVGGKLLGVHLAGRMLGWSAAEARLIGWLLQTKALIMILFVNVLLDRRIISEATFTALLLMAVGSTVLSVPMARPALRQLDSG
ncbi:MAG: cation:proton antiporter [Pseudomonadota bacterium]|nr:cation:proton antiporter [Pseudomonadota bacterium]